MIVSSYGSFTREDTAVIEQFLKNFNHVSTTMKFYPYVKMNSDGADFWINMFPEKDLHYLSVDQAGNRQVDYTLYDGSISSDGKHFLYDDIGHVEINSLKNIS